jgi:4-amino-4-deoxy-L-arabinose transferase-like glycosyltransferase
VAEREPLPGRWLAAIAGLALGWRVVYVVAWGRDSLPFGDGLYYHLQGNLLAKGFGFIEPIGVGYQQGEHASAKHPPLFSLVLSAVTRGGRALGLGASDSTLVHQLTCAVVSAAAVVIIGLLVHRLAGAGACLIAAALAAAYPPLWASDALVMSESLFVLTIALVLLAVYAFYQRPTWWSAVACGLALGAAVLTRSEAVLLVPLLLVPLIFVRAGPSLWWRCRAVGLAALVVAVLCAPWVARNATTFDRRVVLSENIDSAVAGSNCHDTYFGDRLGAWEPGCNAFPPPHGDESEVGATLRHRGLHYARQHTGRIPVVVAARVARSFLLFEPLQDRAESGRSPWTQWATVLVYIPMQVAAIFGLVVMRRRRIPLWPLLGMAVLVVVTSALTYGISRFRVPWDVASVVAVAIGINALLSTTSTLQNAGSS